MDEPKRTAEWVKPGDLAIMSGCPRCHIGRIYFIQYDSAMCSVGCTVWILEEAPNPETKQLSYQSTGYESKAKRKAKKREKAGDDV